MKKSYELLFFAKDSESVFIKMTDEEAVIVKRVLNEANKALKNKNCGRVKLIETLIL